MIKNAKPESLAAQREAPAYSVRKVPLGVSPELTAALKDLAESSDKVARARAGLPAIGAQLGEAKARAEALRLKIERHGGAEAAARAMGLAPGAAEAATGSLAAARAELAKAEDEIAALNGATHAAPDLFEPLQRDLAEQLAAARTAYLVAASAAIAWADGALALAKEIMTEASYLKFSLPLNAPNVARPTLLAADPEKLDEIFAARATILQAATEHRPLVPPREKSTDENFKDARAQAEARSKRIDAVNARSQREGEAWRRKIDDAKEAAESSRLSCNPDAAEYERKVQRLEAEYAEWNKTICAEFARAGAANAA